MLNEELSLSDARKLAKYYGDMAFLANYRGIG